MTRILLLNPNTSTDVTALMAKVAIAAAASDSEIVPVTAPRGLPYIATRAEAAIGAAIVLEMLAEHEGKFEVAIIAAFGDPGLGGARELMDRPILGLAEASMLSACMLGRRFSIVSFSRALGPWFRECVEAHGLIGRLASIRLLNTAVASIGDIQHEKEDALVDLANRAIEEDEADVIVLAGAPLAGLAQRVKSRIAVPVVECVAAAVKQAELLVSLDTRKATAGTYKRPAPKSSVGLSAPLARLFAPPDLPSHEGPR